MGILLCTHQGISHPFFLGTNTLAFKQSLHLICSNPVPADKDRVPPWSVMPRSAEGKMPLLPLGHVMKTRAALAQGFAPFRT